MVGWDIGVYFIYFKSKFELFLMDQKVEEHIQERSFKIL
jgi:hypothetical protein